MKNHFLFIAITIILAIFSFPSVSNSNSTGSPGGKTGSPGDGANCIQCHSNAPQGQGANFTTNIPANGYEPGNTYNITVSIIPGFGSQDPKGFEVTCESNTNNAKAGLFGLTDPNSTQLKNSGTSITHTTAGNSMSSWSFNWVAPQAGTGEITFYGAFIEAGNPIGTNQGDLFNSASISFNEAITNSTTTISTKNDFIFNSMNKMIKSEKNVSVYDMNGKLVLITKNYQTSLSHLNTGVYFLKSDKKSQKITLN